MRTGAITSAVLLSDGSLFVTSNESLAQQLVTRFYTRRLQQVPTPSHEHFAGSAGYQRALTSRGSQQHAVLVAFA